MLQSAFTKKTASVVLPLIQKASYSAVSTATSNGIRVATLPEQSPVASLSVVVGAGSRAEDSSNLGVAHHLKNFGFKNTNKRSALRITREAELQGAFLTTSLGRESLVYSAEFLREDLPYFVELLGEVVADTKYENYEFKDIHKTVVQESKIALANPEVAVIEALHSTAFRSGLGNSIYASPASKVSCESLKAFVGQKFVDSNIAVVANGVEQEQVAELVSKYFSDIANGSASATAPSKYFGGEARIEASGETGHFALAFEGAPIFSDEFAKLQVLRHLLGGEKRAKWAVGGSALTEAASKISGASIATFNTGYSDAGLFGIYVQGPNASVSELTKVAVDQLKKATENISEEEFQRAVAQAKYATVSLYETRLGRAEVYGNQLLASGKSFSSAELVQQIEKISVKDVQNVAAKVLKSKTSSAAHGNVYTLPYADSLNL
ncbi:ubiquinol-cytochrome c reductase core subunit 1 [Basidiobolus ranarum]|uniref:Cytochrome b-c1 complex subunit 2, mitochondrial n=1 Tax=Basidiobolus ranarum TaxID=34480 RepID=A0ABR2WNH7_9FUNG